MIEKALTFDDFPNTLVDALKRAKAWCSMYRAVHTFTITSRNKYEPLTESEKTAIADHIHLIRPGWRVNFDESRVITYD